jgi:hypothetical protein
MENQSAASRYARLASDRTIFLDTARDCAKLSLPYLLTPTTGVTNGQKLPTPWQSIGAKGCNVMASKLMLSLFPVTATFFKLQINDGKLASDPELDATIKSEIDLSLSKMERVIMQHIAESQDRVVLHQAMKHLIVTGNVLVYMGSSGVKLYPLDRYVVVRDGEGQPTEIVTVESINRQFLPEQFQKPKRTVNSVDDNTSMPAVDVTVGEDEAAVYTWAKLKDGQWRWRQEVDGEIIEDSYGKSPKSICPFLPLRFNVCDGEDYGRGRIEEYLGDLKSLEGLMQAMVEGSAAASKVVFLVSPSATVKPSILAKAGNGAIIQGRPDDVSAVQVQKQADFSTAYQMITQLNQRLSEAFLVLTVRQSERTTAEEIRYVSQELNEQLGGIYGNLTTELLRPYLQRKLFTLQRSGVLPKLPKGVVFPTVIAGIEGIGRGQDRESLMQFMQTIAQALGPEALVKYVNPEEAIKRLAAAQGIDPVELIKTAEQRQQEMQQAQQQQMQASMVQQAGQLAKAPMLDPSKNPDALEAVQNTVDGIQEQASGGAQPPA